MDTQFPAREEHRPKGGGQEADCAHPPPCGFAGCLQPLQSLVSGCASRPCGAQDPAGTSIALSYVVTTREEEDAICLLVYGEEKTFTH